MRAGGVIGYGLTTYPHFGGKPVVGFDMGGTSTGVSANTHAALFPYLVCVGAQGVPKHKVEWGRRPGGGWVGYMAHSAH